jgi:phospholipase D1/2
LGEEDLNEKGQKIKSIASSVVRILEEKIVIEKRLPKDQTYEATLKDQTVMEESESVSTQSGHTALVNGGPHEPSTVDGVLLEAPAKHKSPSLKSDVNSEDATASARETLRANLGSRSDRKTWTVPTMKPKVEPQDFEDPISDAFWKNIWIASAVHNVSASSWIYIISNSMLC